MAWHQVFFFFLTLLFKNIWLTELWTHYIAWNHLNLAIHMLCLTAEANTLACFFSYLPFIWTFHTALTYPSITTLPVGMNADRELVNSAMLFEASFSIMFPVTLLQFTLFSVCVLPRVWLLHMYCCVLFCIFVYG